MNENPKFISVRNRQILKKIELKMLKVVICDSYCSTFVLSDGEKFTCSKLLKQVEEILPSSSFIRVNRNVLINISLVKELDVATRTLHLKTGESFKISVRRLKYVKEYLRSEGLLFNNLTVTA